MSEGLCRVHGTEPAPLAGAGGQMCDGCRQRLIDGLRELSRLWQSVEVLASSAATRPRGGGRRGPASSAPTDLDLLAVMDRRSGASPGSELVPVAALVGGWADKLADDRRFARCATVYGQLAMLRVNIDWLVAQTWVVDVAAGVRRCLWMLRRLCGEQRHVIDHCVEPDPDLPDRDCGGPLLQDRDGSAAVVCGRCRTRWSDGDVFAAFGALRRLGMILDSGERVEDDSV